LGQEVWRNSGEFCQGARQGAPCGADADFFADPFYFKVKIGAFKG
jgi:hypothetical protein